MHADAVLALDRVHPFDLSTPVDVFSRIRLSDRHAGYRVRLCTERPQIGAGLFTLRVPWGLEGLDALDILVIPGTADPLCPQPPKAREALLGLPRTEPGWQPPVPGLSIWLQRGCSTAAGRPPIAAWPNGRLRPIRIRVESKAEVPPLSQRASIRKQGFAALMAMNGISRVRRW
ncbi:hypothetical protein [Nocardia sp. NPDC059229]|uniref:hypothetical protein n=1 Tax=Nocardia sp. NPDC059229 TaxID=3346778 RepID=UPI0036C96993